MVDKKINSEIWDNIHQIYLSIGNRYVSENIELIIKSNDNLYHCKLILFLDNRNKKYHFTVEKNYHMIKVPSYNLYTQFDEDINLISLLNPIFRNFKLEKILNK